MDAPEPDAASKPDGASEIGRLFKAGRLVEEYPSVRRALADADVDALRRAGQLLTRLDPDDVVRAHPDVPVVKVAITGHGTLGPLLPPLTAELARHGLLLRPFTGDFDGYVFELGDPDGPLYASDPDLTLCVLDARVVFDEVTAPWRPEDVERVLAEKVRLIEGLAARHAARARGALVINTPPLPSRYTAQLTDHRSRARLGAAWRTATADLLRLGDRHASVIVIDLDPLIAEGLPAVDERLSVYAGQHLSNELLARYAREVGHLARHVAGRTKKCLAVDLDGTLWGGVLGDDGLDGIEVAGGLRGRAFTAFQQTVRQLTAQGVLLAAVSKNDEDAVIGALRDHPEMTLRDEDFVRVVANWRPKHDNLLRLAADLNIGVDAIVFADDSAFECGLVRRELPAVDVVRLDEEPSRHPGRLLADGWFDTVELTGEDIARPARYRENLARQDFLDTFESLEDYLAELDLQVRLETATERQIPRLSQLTLRTNQFNLTTERLQPRDVEARLDDPAARVLSIHSSDRFGDNGLVGAVFLRRDRDIVRIENFLLSCRVFSRGIEQACLATILRHAKATGARSVRAEYRPTAKNTKVRDFYPRNGFTRSGDEFRHDLSKICDPPPHLTLTADLEDTP